MRPPRAIAAGVFRLQVSMHHETLAAIIRDINRIGAPYHGMSAAVLDALRAEKDDIIRRLREANRGVQR